MQIFVITIIFVLFLFFPLGNLVLFLIVCSSGKLELMQMIMQSQFELNFCIKFGIKHPGDMQLESTYQQRGGCQVELSEVTVTTPKVLHFCPITACPEVFIAQYLLKNHMAYFFSHL